MRILVAGAGATGGYFGARLAAAGRDVTFLVRAGRAAQIQEHGLRVHALDGELTVYPVTVTAAELDAPYGIVLLSVRSTGLEAALADIAPAVGPDTVIIPFLNGVAHLDAMTARFGTAVLGGVARVSTMLGEDGAIRQFAPFADITLGELDGSSTPRVEQAHRELSGAGFEVTVSPSIVTAMWAKWAFITSLGAMTCLMRAPVGDIVAVPGGEGLGPSLLAEAAAVCAAAGNPLPAAMLDSTKGMLTQPGSGLTASMFRDLEAGRSVEVEPIFGDLIARARDLGVAVPLLDLATLALRVHQAQLEQATP